MRSTHFLTQASIALSFELGILVGECLECEAVPEVVLDLLLILTNFVSHIFEFMYQSNSVFVAEL